ncbi:MAG: hypothetical protein AAB647_04215 [Patescibacteria group bacterium]
MFSLREKFLILLLALLGVGAGIFLYVKARPSADVVNVPFVTEPMVAAGYDHSVALKADGTVLAWGGNLWGQLGRNEGNNPVPYATQPEQIVGLANVLKISTHLDHTLALVSDGTADGRADDGTVWAWGGNFSGQLGPNVLDDGTDIPTQVEGLTDIIAVAAGLDFSLALHSDGTVSSWGGNTHGQLGNGTASWQDQATPQKIPGLADITALVAGGNDEYPNQRHALALKSDGTVLAWGGSSPLQDLPAEYMKNQGQLGLGRDAQGNPIIENSSSPVPVKNLSNVIAIAAGWTNSIALKANGTIWRWGYHTEVEADDEYQSVPYQVEGITNAVAIEAGSGYALALTQNGHVYTWGQAADVGSTAQHWSGYNSLQVPNLSNITAIAAGGGDYIGGFALVVDAAGSVFAWGNNIINSFEYDDDGGLKPTQNPGRLGSEQFMAASDTSTATLVSVTRQGVSLNLNNVVQPAPTVSTTSSASPSPSDSPLITKNPTVTTSSPTATQTPISTRSSIAVDTDSSHYAAEVVSQSTPQVSVRAGEEITIEAKFKNTGVATWWRDYVNLATVNSQDRCPGFDTVSGWYKCNRARFIEESVAPGETATFRLTWKVPTNKISMTFHESFRLVADEIVWLPGNEISWDVTTLPASGSSVSGPPVDGNPANYSYAFVSQSASSQTISRGETATFTINLLNTGTNTWYQDYFSLGTEQIQDNVPGFDVNLEDRSADGWYKCNRIRFTQLEVAPGEIATFTFRLTAPSNKVLGTYRYYLRPVVDEVAWLSDIGMYFEVTVR